MRSHQDSQLKERRGGGLHSQLWEPQWAHSDSALIVCVRNSRCRRDYWPVSADTFPLASWLCLPLLDALHLRAPAPPAPHPHSAERATWPHYLSTSALSRMLARSSASPMARKSGGRKGGSVYFAVRGRWLLNVNGLDAGNACISFTGRQ